MDTGSLQPLGDYPRSWAHTVFDKFTTLKRGKDLTRDQFREGSVPVAGSNGVMGFHDTANVSAPGITVGRSGSVGRVTYFTQDFWAHNTALFVTDLHGNDARFAAYFLAFLRLGRFGSGASVPTLDRNSFRLMPVIIPPLGEQKKIAGVLGLVQLAIEYQERLMARASELKRAILNQLFTRGLRGERQKETEIGPVPKSWEVVRLGDVAKLQSGGTPARDKPEYWLAGGIPWVKTGEIDYRVIDTTQEMITHDGLVNSAAKVFPKGTLLMAMYGQGVTRGRVGLLGIEAATNQACAAITPCDEHRVSTRFIYYYLQLHYEDLRQMGHGANQRNLNAALIKGFPFSFPKMDEQLRIVEALELLDTKMTLHESKRAALTSLFRTLRHQLMTAQLRVDDLI